MRRKRKKMDSSSLATHESGLRSLIARSKGEAYQAHPSLSEAQADPDGVVVFEGDDGGQIYAVARAAFVTCSESRLRVLLSELDALSWADPDSARLCFESLPIGSGVAGGMGGGIVTADLWVHPKLQQHEAGVRNVLRGRQSSIHQ